MKVPCDQPDDVMPPSLLITFAASAAVGAGIWSLVLFALL